MLADAGSLDLDAVFFLSDETVFEDKGILPSTIKGYRSSITRTFNYFWWN
jgi:hypothetical protein